MTRNATTRDRRVKEGKCSVCLRRAATRGHVTCPTCRTAFATAAAARYETARDAEVCTRSGCGRAARGYLCDDHAYERNERRKARGWSS